MTKPEVAFFRIIAGDRDPPKKRVKCCGWFGGRRVAGPFRGGVQRALSHRPLQNYESLLPAIVIRCIGRFSP